MSGFRIKPAKCLMLAFTLWFALLTTGMPGLHTCGIHAGASASLAPGSDGCGLPHPAQNLARLFSGKLTRAIASLDLRHPARAGATSGIAAAGYHSDDACLACQFMSTTHAVGIAPVIASGVQMPVVDALPTPIEVAAIPADFAPLSPRAPPISL